MRPWKFKFSCSLPHLEDLTLSKTNGSLQPLKLQGQN